MRFLSEYGCSEQKGLRRYCSCDGQTAVCANDDQNNSTFFKEDNTLKKRTETNREKRYFTNSNYRILAENSENRSGFDIWVDLPAERHYLMHHRHNAMVYVLLKDSISLGELARWKPENATVVKRYFGGISIRQIDKMTNSVAHVLKTAEAYFAEMHETRNTRQRTLSNDVKSPLRNEEYKLAATDHEFAA